MRGAQLRTLSVTSCVVLARSSHGNDKTPADTRKVLWMHPSAYVNYAYQLSSAIHAWSLGRSRDFERASSLTFMFRTISFFQVYPSSPRAELLANLVESCHNWMLDHHPDSMGRIVDMITCRGNHGGRRRDRLPWSTLKGGVEKR